MDQRLARHEDYLSGCHIGEDNYKQRLNDMRGLYFSVIEHAVSGSSYYVVCQLISVILFSRWRYTSRPQLLLTSDSQGSKRSGEAGGGGFRYSIVARF